MSTADAPLPVAPEIPGPPPHLLLVRAPYYRAVINGLTWGAEKLLHEAGATHDTIEVAGSYELPQAIAMAIRADASYDGYVALGCIVRGGTDHYEYICRATLDGLMRVAITTACALGTGVLTVHNVKQAEKRSKHNGHNKGAEAAVAALKQICLARRLGSGGQRQHTLLLAPGAQADGAPGASPQEPSREGVLRPPRGGALRMTAADLDSEKHHFQ